MYASTLLRRVGALAIAPALLLGAAGTPVLAVVASPTTTTLNLPMLNPKPVGMTTDISADVAPEDVSGTVTFYDVTGGGMTELATEPLAAGPVLYVQRAVWTVPADFPTGTYLVMAEYSGDSTHAASDSGAASFTVGPRPTTTNVLVSGPHDASGLSAQKGDTVTIDASAVDAGDHTPNQVDVEGTITVAVDGAAVGSFAAPSGGVDVSTASWALGPHAITATYDPGASTDHSGSVSATWSLSLVANAVDASGVGVQYGTFYPYKDGYRDTDAILGTRLERASVAIHVYSPTNKVVKTFAVAAGTGAYTVTWTGRLASGAVLPAGRYRVVQVLTDAAGAQRSFTNYLVLSTRRLVVRTATYTKASSATARVGQGWRAWAFTLPSAIGYKSIVVWAYGHSTTHAQVWFGPQDFVWWPYSPTYWGPGGVIRSGSLALSTGWHSVTASVTRDRYGRAVRVYAWGKTGYPLAVSQVRIVVRYTVLG